LLTITSIGTGNYIDSCYNLDSKQHNGESLNLLMPPLFF